MPVKGMSMRIHPAYPFAESLSHTFDPEPSVHKCSTKDVDETLSLRNSWHSYCDCRPLEIWRDAKGFFYCYGPRFNQGTMLLETLRAARSWDFAAEVRAMETLKSHLDEWAYQCYFLTGTFLETSKRSGVHYLFRRLRPTLAMSSRPDKNGKDVGLRFLAALCLHPVGYFEGTWAGAMVPSDDTLAHLLMMRGSEAKFWAHSEQHHPLEPEAGL